MINVMNNISMLWWGWMSAMFWQVSLLIVFVACIDTLIKRWAWPQLRYALWLLVVLKLVIPPGVSMHGSLIERVKPGFDWIISSNIKEPSTIVEYSPFIISDNSFAVTHQAPVRQSQATFTLSKQLTDIASPSTEMSESPVAKLIWQSYAFVIWLSGMFVLGLWLILRLRNLRMCQSRKDSACVIPQSFHMMMSKCAQRLKLSRIPRVVVTKKVVCPAVFGVFKPMLLIPKGYLGKLSRKDAEHMLLHELAHIKRRDPVVHSFYLILQIVYWFNPLLWLARRQLIHLRELCCDATVARILKNKTNAYRQTLIDIARQFLTKPVEPGLGLLGLFEDANRLLVRLSWLEKKSWRYQKMKNLTVITIITFMLVFVLPMAKAQEQSPTNNHTTPQNGNDVDKEQTAKLLILSERMQALQAELQTLEFEKQKLQKELAALELSRKETALAQEHTQEKTYEQLVEALKKVKVKAEKDKVNKESKETKKMLQMEQLQQQWENSEEFKKWQDDIQKWQSSDELKQWQTQMEQWAHEQATINKHASESTGHAELNQMPHPEPIVMPHPEPVIPPMPEMPPMPQISPMSSNINAPVKTDAPTDVFIPSEHAPMVITPEINHTGSITPHVNVPKIAPSQNVLVTTNRDMNITENKDNRLSATKEMEFIAKVQPGAELVVENKVGKIVLVPSRDGNCDVKVDIRATAETAEEAQEMVEQIAMNNESSSKRFFIKPVKSGNDDWNNLSVDLYITVPSNISVDISTDLGSIEITDLKTQIKAVANVGSIKAVNVVGQIQLTTNVGDIEFVAPHNFSAQLQANTKVGSIESEFPINISKIDFTASQAKGTIGSGENSVRLNTDVGTIRIKKSS